MDTEGKIIPIFLLHFTSCIPIFIYLFLFFFFSEEFEKVLKIGEERGTINLIVSAKVCVTILACGLLMLLLIYYNTFSLLFRLKSLMQTFQEASQVLTLSYRLLSDNTKPSRTFPFSIVAYSSFKKLY